MAWTVAARASSTPRQAEAEREQGAPPACLSHANTGFALGRASDCWRSRQPRKHLLSFEDRGAWACLNQGSKSHLEGPWHSSLNKASPAASLARSCEERELSAARLNFPDFEKRLNFDFGLLSKHMGEA